MGKTGDLFQRRQWQPITVILPGKSHGWRSLVGCHLWGRTELDTTEAMWQQQQDDLVFLYFLVLIAEEGVLISPCSSLNSAFRCLYLSFSPLVFASLLFTAICKASPDSHFAFLHFFPLGMVLIPVSCTVSQTSIHSSSGTLSIRCSPSHPLYNC